MRSGKGKGNGEGKGEFGQDDGGQETWCERKGRRWKMVDAKGDGDTWIHRHADTHTDTFEDADRQTESSNRTLFAFMSLPFRVLMPRCGGWTGGRAKGRGVGLGVGEGRQGGGRRRKWR